MLFFSNLIQICGKVSDIIDAKLSKVVSKLPTLPFEYIPTGYGNWYVNFSKDTTSNDIAKHCAWNDENDKKLVEIEKRLSEQSPNEKAKNFRLKKKYTDTLIKETIYFLSKLSDENCDLILTAKENSKLKKNVAKAAADVIFKSAPLDGVGSDVWKLLWEQARKYSQEEAYKEITFPYTGDDARCVLCHEKLSVEGKSRIISFEEFVKGKVQEEADAAKISFDNLLKDIGDLPSVDILKTKVEASGLTEVDNASILVDTYEALRNRMDC